MKRFRILNSIMDGKGMKGEFMYEYVTDKKFIMRMRKSCGEIMQDLCHTLKQEYDIGAQFYLVGSGDEKLILQNASEPIDLDYNLEIVRCADFDDCRHIKECVRKAFNMVLRNYGLNDCRDFTPSLTTYKMYFQNRIKYSHYLTFSSALAPVTAKNSDLRCAMGTSYSLYHLAVTNNIYFSMDVCIVSKDSKRNCYRLIHEKASDKYYWNIAPNSKNLKMKSEFIKKNGNWNLVRNQYKNIKNHYLQQNDFDHPSFVCYIEAVNNVYNSIKQR